MAQQLSPLHEAVDAGDLSRVHWATSYNRFEVAQLLLRFGAKLDVRNFYGHTPATLATRKGHHDIANAIRAEITRRIRRMERLMALFLAFKATFAEGAKQPLLVRLRVDCPEIVRHVVAFL